MFQIANYKLQNIEYGLGNAERIILMTET